MHSPSKHIMTPKSTRLVVRELYAPRPRLQARLEPHEMHWQVIDPYGQVVREAEQPIHNLILDNAKELIAVHGFSNMNFFAVVGTGSTVPAANQTGLVNERARTSAVPSGESDSVTRTSNGVYEIRRVRQFTSAQVGGQNLTEWGFAPVGIVGNNLMCRELFRDSFNNPITLTLDADQQLRLIYKSRITLGPTVPQAASINITGIGNLSGLYWIHGTTEWGMANVDLNQFDAVAAGENNQLLVTANALVPGYATTGSASGIKLKAITAPSYVAFSKQRRYNDALFGTNELNQSIKTLGLGVYTGAGTGAAAVYKFGLAFMFDTGQEIVKNNLHELTLQGFGVAWT